MRHLLSILLALATIGNHALAKPDFYKEEPQFHFFPDPEAPRTEIGRLGPIGLGLELRQPNFTMFIKNVEEGSPAAATGKLKPGQMVESINGRVLEDIDPRVQLGNLITEIEATDGVVKLMVKEDAKSAATPVEFKIPVMGTYSDTWPENCPKSERIVKEMSDFLRNEEQWGWGAALFMLSTGEEKDLEEVRKRYQERFGDAFNPKNPGHTWSIGYTGIGVAEYYLRTGDEFVLPAMKAMADQLRDTMYNGSWMGRGGANFKYMAGGHLNAAGLHAVTFLLMAKECGVEVDERTLLEGLHHIYRFAGRGNVAYGDQQPEGGMVDNGKVGKLAFAMQAAANLSPDGEASVYAKARDISATKSFYSTSWMFHGHTGGGIGELWRGPAMAVVKEERPRQYRSFMDERRWAYELARTHRGSFGWASGTNVSYTAENTGKPCGNYIPLIYTLHRKQLRIFGAPPTKHSHTYELPKRPWGNAADEAFYSLQPAEYAPGKSLDMNEELLPTHASAPIIRRLESNDVTDEELLGYIHHIDHGIRSIAAGYIVHHQRHHLIVPLLRSGDPRVRRAALQTMTGHFKSPALPEEFRTDEMIELAGAMVADPEESWWVCEAALRVLGMGSAGQAGTHIDRIEFFLKHEEWWLRSAAMEAARPLVTHKDYYERLLPLIGDSIATNTRAAALTPVRALVAEISNAEPPVRELATQTIGKAYVTYPDTIDTPGNRDMSSGVSYLTDQTARNLASLPGGLDVLFEVAKTRHPQKALPHLDLYLAADPQNFGPKLKEAFVPLMRDQVIWQFMLRNCSRLKQAYESRMPDRWTEELVGLYEKIGVHDYSWKLWSPPRDRIEWQYFSYDPPEEMLREAGSSRYRAVSWPDGADDWMQPGFDAKQAGWKTGRAPFAHMAGKLATTGGCTEEGHFCGCGTKPNTFWEKEVLLMRAKLDLPAMQDDHGYRMLVGGRSHVGGGDGSDVWINGKLQGGDRKGTPSIPGVGKRAGGKPVGFVFGEELRKEFTGRPVTIAATGFLKTHKSGVVMNRQSFWIESMKMPTFGEKELLKALSLTPLRTSAWQETGDDALLYQFDGTFAPNESLHGTWQLLGQLADGETFDPDKGLNRARWFGTITFEENGKTADDLLYYSGDHLLDLKAVEALKITPKTIDGTDYLFIESGGFAEGAMVGESLPQFVMKRKSP